mgnify:CR=1 FL=1
MEWPKLKNIIILILLLVNGFLLVLVVGREFQVSRYERSAFTQAGQVLAQNGITVDEDLLEQAVRESLVPLTVQRDLQAEMDIAQALLGGQAVRTDQGGGLYGYDSDRGSALFRSNGDFSFSLLDCPLDGQSPSNHAADILKQMGLNGEELGSQTAGTDQGFLSPSAKRRTCLYLPSGLSLWQRPPAVHQRHSHDGLCHPRLHSLICLGSAYRAHQLSSGGAGTGRRMFFH